MFDPINAYFKLKGVDVSYNTLNGTDELIRAYIKDYQGYADATHNKWSHHAKNEIYSTMYEFMPRTKYTGFEGFKKQDTKFRRNINPLMTDSVFKPTPLLDRTENSKIDTTYKDALKRRVAQFKNPLLYYSGGIDSELVAMAMLDTGVKFTPVVFELIDATGVCRNSYDISHAYNFCNKHGLYPIVKSINIDELWNSSEFTNLAVKLQIRSPQLLTHVHMIETMEREFNGRTHVFGGEVRFYSTTLVDNSTPANLIQLVKEVGLGIDGDGYFDDYAGPTPGMFPTGVGAEIYNTTVAGFRSWYIQEISGGLSQPNWYQDTGSPSPTFYYNVTSATLTKAPGVINAGSTNWLSPGWNTMTSGYNFVGYVERIGNTYGQVNLSLSVSIYGSAGGIGSAVSGSFTLGAWASM